MASYKNALDRLIKEAYLEEELRKLVDDVNTDLASDKSIVCSLRKIYRNSITYYHIIFNHNCYCGNWWIVWWSTSCWMDSSSNSYSII